MELDRVDRVTAGAVGEPGERVFYIQARAGTELVTVLAEKEQVGLLAASVIELLARIDRETEELPFGDELNLEEPLEPRFRVGRLSIGFDENRDLILLELEELLPEDEETDEETGAALPAEPAIEPERIRVWATPEQMLALSRHAAAVVSAGRPLCPLCGNPLDPEGHTCPALNGHRDSSTS